MEMFKKFSSNVAAAAILIGLTFGTLPCVLLNTWTTDVALSIGLSALIVIAVSMAIVYMSYKDEYKGKDREKWGDIFWGGLLIVVLGGASFVPYLCTATVDVREVKVINIPFQTKYENVDYVKAGETSKSTGKQGEKEVTYIVTRKMIGRHEVIRKIVDESIITEPKDEIIYIGTYVDPQPSAPAYEENSYGPTALCEDGTYSYSTGSGTCSHHKGVAQWL